MKYIPQFALIFFFAVAQPVLQGQESAVRPLRQQVAVMAAGQLTHTSSDDGLQYKPTSSAGFSAGYRYSLNRWLGVEGDYDGFFNSQKYQSASEALRLRASMQAATGSLVFQIPILIAKDSALAKRTRPFMTVGGGALLFDPRDDSSYKRQTEYAVVFGGGADITLNRSWAVRVASKTYLHKAPQFDASLTNQKLTQTMVPSVGVVYNF